MGSYVTGCRHAGNFEIMESETEMDDRYLKHMENLNHEDATMRLDSLRRLAAGIARGDIPEPGKLHYGNNHIHTCYSFSPYSPSKAVWMAYSAGLATAGIVDHDSVGGAREFIEAGRILGMATTIGVECRADFSKTRLNRRHINNPDQNSLAYMAVHGIPHTRIECIRDFFAPYSKERNVRNEQMTKRLNGIMKPFDINLDFEQDVKSISKSDEGGSITERHILYALSHKLVEKFGKGRLLTSFLRLSLKIGLNTANEQKLSDSRNIFYEYDLLGILKSNLLEHFYIDAEKECPDVRDVIALCKETGSIAAYAYLGDVEDSVTGDKKRQAFEDDYLEELFETIKELGFHALTYMPARNTSEQLKRVKNLCEKHGMFQISGEDINSPRQMFTCKPMENPEFGNLVDSGWALVGHELAATEGMRHGMFSDETLRKHPGLEDRIQIYKQTGLLSKHPDKGDIQPC